MDRTGGLDAIDQKIIEQLRQSPRTQNRALAKAVGVSVPTLYVRLRALEEAKVCEVRAQRDLVSMGYRRLGYVDVTVVGRAVRDVATDIAAIDATLAVLEFVEDPRLLVPLVAADDEALHRLIVKEIGGVPGVSRVATSTALRIHRYRHDFGEIGADRHLPLCPTQDQVVTEGPDEAILEALRLDSRLSNRRISDRLGLSEANVRRRVIGLQERKVLTFTLVASPAALGLTVWGHIRLSYPPQQSREVIDYIMNSQECVSIVETSGQWNLHCWALFQDEDALSSFADKLSDVIGHEISSSVRKIHRVEKHNCDYVRIL